MARTPKPSGRKWRGPFTFAHLEKAIALDGWQLITGHRAGTKHPAYEHASKTGKVNLDKKWTSIRANDEIFKSVARQAGLSPRRLLGLLQRITR